MNARNSANQEKNFEQIKREMGTGALLPLTDSLREREAEREEEGGKTAHQRWGEVTGFRHFSTSSLFISLLIFI